MRFVYSLVFYLATPLILLHFTWRGRQDARWLKHWRQRFGRPPVDAQQGCIMIHAASVGEVNAAAGLIESLLERHDAPVFVTTFTPTGSQRSQDLFGNRVAHGFIPLDLPGACKRLLNGLTPRLLVIMETEIWPNLFHRAAVCGTPVLMVNAQISSRSVVSYRRFARVTAPALASVSRVLAASEEDVRRFVDCGADATSVTATGNIKFDLSLSPGVAERGRELRAAWGAGRDVIVAGSTHEADETALFEAFTQVLESNPCTLLVLAPRHPERFDAAAASAKRCGFNVIRQSLAAEPGPACQCFLLDTMGALQAAYGAADLAFIGGSFSDIGGHNPLEAALLSVPALTGPDMSGQADIHQVLIAGGAARQVMDAGELATAMVELLGDESLRKQMGAAGAAAIAQNRGATECALEHVSKILDRTPGNPRAIP